MNRVQGTFESDFGPQVACLKSTTLTHAMCATTRGNQMTETDPAVANDSQFFAAADLGASSGRVILGELKNGRMTLTETGRFPNGPVEEEDGLHWDSISLFNNVVEGIKKALEESDGELTSVGIDTWGVDYGRLDKDGELVEMPWNYRDERTTPAVEEFFSNMSPEDLYAISGLQVQPFNTIFQFVSDKDAEGWEQTETVLFTPDLLSFWLTGEKNAEVTIASTSGLVDPETRQWSQELLDHVEEVYGVPAERVLPDLVEPGTVVGKTKEGLLDKQVDVVASASHDTASAVVAVPAKDSNFAFISSGTWSLVGMELDGPVLSKESSEADLTNELGADGTVRYLQNIMGLWVYNECRKAWKAEGKEIEIDTEVDMAGELPALGVVIDITDGRLMLPGADMPERVREIAAETGQELPDDQIAITRCLMDSLALAYRNAINMEQELAGRKADVVHIVGGGSKNTLLCQLTSEATGLPVVAGPKEGTALGNLLIQARAAGAIAGGLPALREVSRNSVEVTEYQPGTLGLTQEMWDEANEKAFPTK